jgi:serine/threonine protein kinase
VDVRGTIQYRKLAQIGVGQGMNSKVFRVHDPHLAREIAVKEVDRNSVGGGGWDAYHREARCMFASRHPNVVEIHYACVTPICVSLAMPYFAAGSLTDRICDGPMSLHGGYRVADGILSAISQVHVARLVHLDVKPSNVLFSDTGEPMIADFGQAALMDARGIAALDRLYPFGIPPEAYTHGVGLVESDVYQVGLTLYRLFNGDPYFKDQLARVDDLKSAVVGGRLPDRKKFLPHVPSGIRRVIRRALQVDPHERFRSAVDFQDSLGRVALPWDWSTEFRPDGEITWRADGKGACAYEVQLLRHGTRHWRTDVHTNSGPGGRRRAQSSSWVTNATAAEADRSLRSLFQRLG